MVSGQNLEKFLKQVVGLSRMPMTWMVGQKIALKDSGLS